MAKLIVYYPRHEGCSFDRDYYLANHAAIVTDAWGATGLIDLEIEWPYDDAQPFACIAKLQFADQASIDASLGSEAAAKVMGDVARFTDIQPGVYRTV